MADNKKNNFYEQVAETIIEQLKDGTAPWLKPWKPGQSCLPHNPVSGTRYKGGNAMWLAAVANSKGYKDTRWMTYKQAKSINAQVNRGEKGARVQYFKYSDRVLKRDEDGKPILGEDGKPEMKTVMLERPKVFSAVVFNGEQIEGLPPQERRQLDWNPQEKAETILANSGATIIHNQNDRAYYSPATDKIHLPGRDQFDTADSYYATALHELGHWTGHSSRLDRDILNPFGSEGYAKEELRAEIASMILGDELGIGHDPGQHVAYVGSWIKALQNDPAEIFRASRDAEKIMTYVLDLEHAKEQTIAQENTVEKKEPRMADRPKYLSVPFAEKDQAKQLGARWDKNEELWFVPAGKDINQFDQWLPENNNQVEIKEDPHVAFGEALKDAGFVIKGLPVMDGKLQRVPLEDDKKGKKNGAYVGYLDGDTPLGVIKNWKKGTKEIWKGQGKNLSPEQRKVLQAEAAEQRKQREVERVKLHNEKARKCEYVWKNLLKPADPQHPYLQKKGVGAYGLQQNDKGDLVIPARLADGKFKTIQMINPEGVKLFAKDSNNEAAFHLIPGKTKTTDNIILVASGYATAASGHEATGRPVVVAFNDWNLQAVAESIMERSPEKKILFLGDDDHVKEKEGKGNSGKTKTIEAAQAVGGKTVFPRFTKEELDKGLTDFNDLHQSRGKDAVAWQVNTALKELQKEMQQTRKQELDKAFKLGIQKEKQSQKQKKQENSIAL